MILHLTPYELLKKECQEINDFLNITPSDNPEEIIERGNELQAYLARTAKLVADARYYYNEELRKKILATLQEIINDRKLSAKVQNALVESIGREQKYYADWTERLNRACVHQIDWCRSRLSYEKEQLKQNYPIQY